MPLGQWVLKYRSFFFFFFSLSRICKRWLDVRDHVMCFLSRANPTARCRQCFVAEFFQVYIVFLVVVILAKTECYSPSNLLVRSAMYRTSATCQWSTCRKWYAVPFQALHDQFSHKTYKHHTSTVTCLESKLKKSSRSKRITQGKSKPLTENIFSYQSSYWGMSTPEVPVLFYLF